MGSVGSHLRAGRPDIHSPRLRRLGGVAWRWLLAFLLWLTPSLGLLVKFAGWPGAAIASAAAAIGIAVLLAWTLGPPAPHGRPEPPWRFVIAVALCAVFAAAYPVAASGLLGRGSDRAGDVERIGAALLAGRLIYGTVTFLGNPPSPMPGAVVLALPFHLLGSAALQNVFWFASFCALAPRIVGGARGGAAYLAIFVLGCPAMLLDFATGGDFATNAIYVIISAWLMTRLAPDETWPVRCLACLFFACALSSRAIYLVEAPIVAGVLLRRDGLRRTFWTMACVGVLLAVINGPIWAADPAHFPMMLHVNLFDALPRWMHGALVIPALSIAIACGALFLDMERGRMWLLSAISLAPMVIPAFLFLTWQRGFVPRMLVLESYTLPLALFAGLWLLRPRPAEPAPASS